ncbi:class I SAM-dependent methyltransferase [Campylobacter insulaenigrae]|uniref:class I SAM-dependent methyltransferase n=1 Tax=Campylobacter insulaenigrae TaxID=260714 RepID=UPI0021524752|nr:class I SAM-dependent methyltransferase [Campylobacter insulaenigrae]MCR6587650.1 class I SAM-dependent methyltransferase [Campylobacter insulaenigrae]
MKQGDFSEVAKHYHNRPAYSTMLIQKLIKCVNDKNKEQMNVVEVGAGTGKLTKILADEFNLLIDAVEPNDNMREEGIKFTQNSKNITWHKGSGEVTNIESDYADWLIMASSFHWTDPNKSLPEFARVLHGGGYFTAIWNPRHIVEGSVFYEIEEEIKHIVPELARVSSGTQNVKNWEEILVSTGDFKDCFFMECDYYELMDKQRYLGAWHSVNDIQAQAGKARWEEILKMIENKISSMDVIKIPYKIRAWTVRKA